MREFLIFALRIPFVVIAIASIIGLLKEPTLKDIVVVSGGVSLCIGMWHVVGVLKQSSEEPNTRNNTKKIRFFLLIAVIGIAIGTRM